MLSPEQTRTLLDALEDQKRNLLENAREALGFTRDRDRSRIGRDSVDESAEEALYSTALRLRDRERYLLGKINAALGRIEDGEIDECEDCSEEIGYQRLLARPVTTLCINCKEDREANEE